MSTESRYVDDGKLLACFADEVLVHQDGRRVILEPADDWPDAFRKCLGVWKDEIARPPAVPLRDPFA